MLEIQQTGDLKQVYSLCIEQYIQMHALNGWDQ